jgi:uncharacterized Zn finger protein (UPF0148 family)
MEITGKTPTEAPYGMHTYVCPECGKTVYCATDDAELICDSCNAEMQLTAENERNNEDMRNFEDDNFELTEDERYAMEMTLSKCIENATDAQLQAIHSYALEIAPLPHAENVDRKRINALHKDISDVIIGVSDKRIPATVSVAAYKALGIYQPEDRQAQEALVDYLNDCTATAYQTGNTGLLEEMHRVVTTIHDLIGDYDELERKYFQPATPADIDEL